MRIFIDIGHPAHVHYFRNFIHLMQEKGHEFFVSARKRSIIQYLLDTYKIHYYNRGKGMNGVLGKLFYMIIADFKLLKQAIRYKPDIFISFASPYAAQVSCLLRKPHIVIDDTEHARFSHFFYKAFSSDFLNPASFKKQFGKRQIFFKSYAELFYLHKNYYSPNLEIRSLLYLKEDEKYIILRFVSWEANHDAGMSGLDIESKRKLVKWLIDHAFRVFITTEKIETDPFLNQYVLKIPPQHIHDALYYASLLITEGATMASEAAMLGTPAIYINSLDAGTLREQEDKYQLIYGFRSPKGVFEKVKELLSSPNLKENYQSRSQKMLSEKIDVTAFLIWFIENYPESVKVMRENPEYQERFR